MNWRALVMKILAHAIALPLLLILTLILIAAPVELVLETIELVSMDVTAAGMVEKVEVLEAREDRVSRSVIRYKFLADGQEIVSDRLVPGLAERHLLSRDGDAISKRYRPGQRVVVHHHRGHPETCALEYGWYVATVAVTAILAGIMVRGLALKWIARPIPRVVLAAAGASMFVYGLIMPIRVDSTVRVADLGWHVLAWTGLFAACLVVDTIRGTQFKDDEDEDEDPDQRPRWRFSVGTGSGD